ncbi:MAG: single stranded DNA-binding domain-containing protein [Armatimonadota bacterium]
MRKKLGFVIIAICGLMLSCASQARNTWFADIVANSPGWYNPGPGQFTKNPLYNDPFSCIGAPDVADELWSPKTSATNRYVVTLGDRDPATNRGWIVLGFSEPVQDDPKNPYGLDFIVFSNCYFPTAMPPLYYPSYRWQEPAFVEISQDLVTWYLIRPNILPSALNSEGRQDTGASETALRGYAEYTPSIHLPTMLPPDVGYQDPFSTVTRTHEELYTVPERPSLPDGFNTINFDYVSGGGDAFDVRDAVVQSASGVPALDGQGMEIPANITWFKYIRLTDAVHGDQTEALGEISAEIDAASAIRPAVNIGEAKRLSEGGYAIITEAMVTAVFADAFFIESPDRSAAMKVIYDTSQEVDGKAVAIGDKVTVTGHVSKAGNRFVLPDPMFSCTSITDPLPKPIGMGARLLDSDMAYAMLVRTWGKVTESGTGYCVISDDGRRARVTWSDERYAAPAVDKFVCATGVCDREEAISEAIIRVSNPLYDINVY